MELNITDLGLQLEDTDHQAKLKNGTVFKRQMLDCGHSSSGRMLGYYV
jgi:hypothetical protein